MRNSKKLFDYENLSGYVAKVRDIPSIDNTEEVELATRWKEKNDYAAIDKIVKSHLKLVAKIANGYRGYGMPLSELIAEGNVGIMQAVKHFDCKLGYKFSTYAMWWIQAKIKEFIFNSWSIVKLANTKCNKKLFFKLRKTKNDMGVDTLDDGATDKIAEHLNVKSSDVLVAERRFTSKDFSIHTPVGGDGQSGDTFQDFLSDDNAKMEDEFLHAKEFEKRKKILHDALNTLSPREYKIVTQYRLHEPPKTFKNISEELKISAERVRQIESSAFVKIQKYVRSHI